jgi:hypothetical protein
MLPDYPHKLFGDKRNHFELLMETLAMNRSPKPSCFALPAITEWLSALIVVE